MEFTTRFGLHSQATRLREDPGPARRGPLPASHRPRAGPRSEGLGPPTSGAGEWVFRTPHFPRPTAGRGFGAGLFPVHSPLLRESWLVSFEDSQLLVPWWLTQIKVSRREAVFTSRIKFLFTSSDFFLHVPPNHPIPLQVVNVNS